jgi:hypothetical protein
MNAPLTDAELDKKATETFDSLIDTSAAEKGSRSKPLWWIWRYTWVQVNHFLKEVDESFRRGPPCDYRTVGCFGSGCCSDNSRC